MIAEIELSNAQACKLWAVSRKTLAEWVSKGFPLAGKNRYCLFAGMTWVRANVWAESAGATLTEARTKLVQSQADLKTLDLMVRRGDLIPRRDVLGEFLSRIGVVRAGLLSLHRVLAVELRGLDFRQAQALIRGRCHELLALYSRGGGVLGPSRGQKRESSDHRYFLAPEVPGIEMGQNDPQDNSKESFETNPKSKPKDEAPPPAPTAPITVKKPATEYYSLQDLKNRLGLFDNKIIRRIFSKATGPGKVGVEADGQADFLIDKLAFEKWWQDLPGDDVMKISNFQRYE